MWGQEDFARARLLAAILKDNPIPAAYRLNYVANFYVGPLIKRIEQKHKMTRPEWIVLFCLMQQSDLNAQQISNVTGRAKTSISAAVRQLERKKLIVRQADVNDARRQVLEITAAGQRIYKAILGGFIERETSMIACLSHTERQTFMTLLDKIIDNAGTWAQPY
ncbi:MAG: MarR family winged helix-turn-helix transcriptional regulator [Rhizobiaceae bacterium]